jgi:hypothetical protein
VENRRDLDPIMGVTSVALGRIMQFAAVVHEQQVTCGWRMVRDVGRGPAYDRHQGSMQAGPTSRAAAVSWPSASATSQ